MKFLIDTNILIPAEPTRPQDIEPGTPVVVNLLRLLEEGAHQVYVHAASLEDIRRDADVERRRMREVLFGKYPQLPTVPALSARLEAIIGTAAPGSHDMVDHALLAALDADAVDYLVTEDRGLRRKGERAGLLPRVATPSEALAVVRGLFPVRPEPPPAVHTIRAYQLKDRDPIFDSLRADYPEFDAWLQRCKREHREAWVIQRGAGAYEGICIIKPEQSGEFGLRGKVLKLSTFKIAEDQRGFGLGELLLKTAFNYTVANGYEHMYLTTFPKHTELITLMEDFGFESDEAVTDRGEIVLKKHLKRPADTGGMSALAVNVRYGPFTLMVRDVPTFVIPILPRFHGALFPEAESQLELAPGRHTFGNSIRKAYLCNAASRAIEPGAVLLFYRSRESQGVRCIGVAETTLVSRDPNEVARFVGKRTVYSLKEITDMCCRPILAILFRLARVLPAPISLGGLVAGGVVRRAPQSIVRVQEEGCAWLETQLSG